MRRLGAAVFACPNAKFTWLMTPQEKAAALAHNTQTLEAALQMPCDLLILDEVLSVGDGSFRKKSGDKMKEILARGVTGILVSHSVNQVRELCNKVLWLNKGKVVKYGDALAICDEYKNA